MVSWRCSRGMALRKTKRRQTGMSRRRTRARPRPRPRDEAKRSPRIPSTAPAYMTQAVLGFNEQLERIGEVAVVLLVGAMLSVNAIPGTAHLVRPVAVPGDPARSGGAGADRLDYDEVQRAFIGWFGIRGIGSIYYLMYAIVHGVSDETARLLIGLTLAVVATSVVVDGVSVTPLMRRYRDATSDGD